MNLFNKIIPKFAIINHLKIKKGLYMILVMKVGASKEEIDATINQIKEWGHDVSLAPGEKQTVIGIIGDKVDLGGRPLSTTRC